MARSFPWTWLGLKCRISDPEVHPSIISLWYGICHINSPISSSNHFRWHVCSPHSTARFRILIPPLVTHQHIPHFRLPVSGAPLSSPGTCLTFLCPIPQGETIANDLIVGDVCPGHHKCCRRSTPPIIKCIILAQNLSSHSVGATISVDFYKCIYKPLIADSAHK